ncbi:MAG: hypothetical protein ACRD22_17430 [Terriglobia bacterium]
MRASAILLTGLGLCSSLFGATISTSVSCSFYGQPVVSDPHSCSIEQESSLSTDRGTAAARSYVSYTINGNALTVSFFQDGEIRDGGFSTPNFNAEGYFTTSGSIDLSIKTAGSGPALAEVDIESLGSIDPGGEEHGGFGFDLGGFSWDCSGSSYPDLCVSFPPYPSIPFEMNSILDFHMSEDFEGDVDRQEVNPFSAAGGTTTFQFLFTDGAGNPVDISEVPEPRTAGFLIVGAILASLMAIVPRRRLKAPVCRGRPYLSAGSVSLFS